jgi:integrase/DNA-binding Xre family transcriptional regulator
LALALVRDMRELRAPSSAEEIEAFETDVLAGFVLARASAGLADSTIRNDTGHLDLIREWFGRPLREMQPEDADAYFGRVLRDARPSTRTGRAAALAVFFQFLELRHKAEICNLTSRVAECPLDEMNRPRASVEPQLRVPPSEAEAERLFAGWREELAACRKFAPAARNYAAARLQADVGLRVNEVRMLDLDDVRWDLGRFGKLNVRHGKGSRRKGPKPRLVPLINGADRNLRWFIEDVRGQFGDDHEKQARRPAVPVRAQDPGRLLLKGDRRRVPPVAGRGRQPPPARMVGEAHPARPSALLRLAALPVRDDPVRHPGATRTFPDRDHRPLRPRPRHPRRGRLGGRPAARRRPLERTRPVKWNLRLAAASRGIWKASELQRMLAARGMVISAGKMSGLWSGHPNTIRLDELDVICAVLGCGVDELLLPEPGKVPQPAPEDAGKPAAAAARAVTPRSRDGRSLPPR